MKPRERINQIVRERLDKEKEKGMVLFDPEFLQDELIESIIIYLEETMNPQRCKSHPQCSHNINGRDMNKPCSITLPKELNKENISSVLENAVNRSKTMIPDNSAPLMTHDKDGIGCNGLDTCKIHSPSR